MRKVVFRLITLVVLAALAAGGYWWWTHRSGPSTDLVLHGNVEVRQVNLGFKVSGRIQILDFDEGSAVKAGQRLASLDTVYFHDTIAQLTARRNEMQANLAKMEAGYRPEEIAQSRAVVVEREATVENAMATLRRAKALLKTVAGTQKAYDDALAAHREAIARLEVSRQNLALMQAGYRIEEIEATRAQLATSEAELQIANRQLIDAELFAPNDGTILTRVKEVGAIVNAGETVFVLSLTSPVWIRTYVSEIDLSRIAPGQEVEIRVDTPGIAPMRGRIGFISTTAEFTPKTVETVELRTALVYRLRIVADDPRGVLRQGMPVTVTTLPQGPGAEPSGLPETQME